MLECKPELQHLQISNHFIGKRQTENRDVSSSQNDKKSPSENATINKQDQSFANKKEMKIKDESANDLTHSCTKNSISMIRKPNNVLEFSFKVCFLCFINLFKLNFF